MSRKSIESGDQRFVEDGMKGYLSYPLLAPAYFPFPKSHGSSNSLNFRGLKWMVNKNHMHTHVIEFLYPFIDGLRQFPTKYV